MERFINLDFNVLYKRNCRGIYGEKFNIVAL